jgi:hypothetical protein
MEELLALTGAGAEKDELIALARRTPTKQIRMLGCDDLSSLSREGWLQIPQAGVIEALRGRRLEGLYKERLELFQETERQSAAKGGTLGFPNRHSSQDPHEFFAECGAMFLTEHVDGAAGGAMEAVTTREDLRRVNPRAFELLEKFFSKTAPMANREKRGISAESRVAFVEARIGRLKEEAERRPTFAKIAQLAQTHLQLARAAKSPEHFDQAKQLLDQLRHRFTGPQVLGELFGLVDKARFLNELGRELDRGLDGGSDDDPGDDLRAGGRR